jgi:prevent-host-death family protein
LKIGVSRADVQYTPGKTVVGGSAADYILVKLVKIISGETMSETINLYDAKTNLSKLVDRAAGGEEIIIAKAGKPKAKLVPYDPPRKKRVFGQNLLGMTYMAEDWKGPILRTLSEDSCRYSDLDLVRPAAAKDRPRVTYSPAGRWKRRICQRRVSLGDRDKARDRQAGVRRANR